MANKERRISFNKDRFREALKEKKVTLKALCKKAGLSYETIRRSVSDGKIMPDNLIDLCKALDYDPDYLVGNIKSNYGYFNDVNTASSQLLVDYTTTISLTRKEIYVLLLKSYNAPKQIINVVEKTPELSSEFIHIHNYLSKRFNGQKAVSSEETIQALTKFKKEALPFVKAIKKDLRYLSPEDRQETIDQIIPMLKQVLDERANGTLTMEEAFKKVFIDADDEEQS